MQALPASYRYAFEFRDRGWYNGKVFVVLADHGAALCIHDLAGCQPPHETTTNFVYLRLHGPDGPYRGKYGKAALRGWADRLAGWNAEGRDVYCYFNNDEKAYAVANALTLKDLVATAASRLRRKKGSN